MGYRVESFAPGEIYHICTRGVEQRDIFKDDQDRGRFLKLLHHCLPIDKIQSYSIAQRLRQKPKKTAKGKGLVDLLAYCLMTNHVHLLLQENIERGISQYLQRLFNSYAKYFNIRYHRSGPLFMGRFRAVSISDDEQLLHVSRYIHLNPYVAHITKDFLSYPWSSQSEYTRRGSLRDHCHTLLIKSMMKPERYQHFLIDEADYARSMGDIKHLLLEKGPN